LIEIVLETAYIWGAFQSKVDIPKIWMRSYFILDCQFIVVAVSPFDQYLQFLKNEVRDVEVKHGSDVRAHWLDGGSR
jgi:hypothetical protein